VALVQPEVLVGRSPEWQGKQVVGVVLPVRWNLPPAQLVVHVATAPLLWQVVQSPMARLSV
jgi:hypothetical protein